MKATCSVSTCELPNHAHGYCSKHAMRVRKNGTPYLEPKPTPIERFWAKVDRSNTNGCWEWTGYRDRRGYGTFQDKCAYGYKPYRASRWIWTYLHGPIPDGLLVRHKCDNPPCVNPDHLELGTHEENCRDRDERDRTLRGSKAPAARLTESDVRVIRRDLDLGISQLSLAERFGVSRRSINSIARRKTWTHI